MARDARTALVLIFLTGACWVLISPWLAERLLFLPDRGDPGPPPVIEGVRGMDVLLEASDGVELHGWWYRVSGDAPAVLLLHGNAGNIAHRTPLAAGYLARGISIFLLDYRGYGRSRGFPSESGVYRDAQAAVAFLAEEVGTNRLVVHGRSLGGAVAVHTVGHGEAAGMILDGTFTSLSDMARAVYPFIPRFALWRISDRFDTRSAMKRISVPILVVHGTLDEIVPSRMGRELYEAAAGPRSWYPVEGAGHNDVLIVGGEAYLDRIANFVREVVLRPPEIQY